MDDGILHAAWCAAQQEGPPPEEERVADAALMTTAIMGTDQERALEAVLLFFDPSPWDVLKRYAWYGLTGDAEATTKVLCATVRKALKKDGLTLDLDDPALTTPDDAPVPYVVVPKERTSRNWFPGSDPKLSED